MGKDDRNRTYVNMMIDSLRKKKAILDDLYALTIKQEELLTKESMDTDEFEKTTEDKGSFLDELNHLDEGFDSLYKKLETELMARQAEYADEISMMKGLIREITDTSSKIQVTEKKNYDRFQKFVADERVKIKKANLNNQTASTYAKNMAGGHKEGNSYFVNETK